MVKPMNRFVKFITFNQAIAITLLPFGIYIKDKYIKDEIIINHENIHKKQQLEMGIIFFYIWYSIEYLVRCVINYKYAYWYLSFEREAYINDKNTDYLKTRKRFSWFKYLKS